jgi:hypothetical protein
MVLDSGHCGDKGHRHSVDEQKVKLRYSLHPLMCNIFCRVTVLRRLIVCGQGAELKMTTQQVMI